jgi:hypothetical protein
MRCSYYPQSPAQICGAIRRSGVGFGVVDPRVLFIPTSSGHTGLTGASHRSDRCKPLLGFSQVNVWLSSLLSRVSTVSSLGLFGARWACLVFWGFLAWTGLTGVLHLPDWCKGYSVEISRFHQQGPV